MRNIVLCTMVLRTTLCPTLAFSGSCSTYSGTASARQSKVFANFKHEKEHFLILSGTKLLEFNNSCLSNAGNDKIMSHKPKPLIFC